MLKSTYTFSVLISSIFVSDVYSLIQSELLLIFVRTYCNVTGPLVPQCVIPNGPVTLHYGLTKISNNLCWIKLYTSDTNIEDITTENMYVDFNI